MTADGDQPESSLANQPIRLGELVVIYLKGLAMGAADAVPGVSGGTIALITGIYERLIRALTALDPRVLRHLSSVHRRTGRHAFWRGLKTMDMPFLVALGLGMVSAVVILARGVQLALSTVPGPTFAFFAGLIAASAVLLFDRRWLTNPAQLGAGIAGFLIAFGIAGASTSGILPQTLPMVFVAGMFAISGMVLPGISGAFILLLLGQYEYMTAVLTAFTDQLGGLAFGGGVGTLVDDGIVILTFLTGAFAGLFTVAYAVRWALERYRGPTFAFLVSLMVGALRYPAERMTETTSVSVQPLLLVLVAAISGALVVFLLDYYTADLDYDTV